MTDVPHDATRALVDAVRELIDVTRLAAAPVDVLAAAAAQVDAARALLAPHRFDGITAQGALDGGGYGLLSEFLGEPGDYFPYSPIVGPLNPIAPPVRLWAGTDGRMHGEAQLGAAYTGPPGLVHGGIIALVFDELLGACAILNEAPGFTGTLTVKYLRGTPVRAPLALEAWIDRIEGRKTFVTGEVRNGDVVTATATGIFIATAHQIEKR